MQPSMPTAVVLISGNGSNLQAIIDASTSGIINTSISAVISNRPDAYGIQRAIDAGIPTRVIDHTLFETRTHFDQHLQKAIDEFQPDVIVLAGFMRILTIEFTEHYLGKMINIHPSLLPKYPGLNTHQKALDSGDNIHGVTVHFVTPELDDGPNIIQATVPINAEDTAESLARKVQIQEHEIYPKAVDWLANKNIKMIGNRAYFEDKLLTEHGIELDH
jgi:phosphoribosylglycinamide formyltransferase-1